MEKDFEIVDHTADVGIIAYGADELALPVTTAKKTLHPKSPHRTKPSPDHP